MSRRLVRQTVFELPENIPPAKRNNALDLLVRKWSPFSSTAYATQWMGNRASVYAWDRNRVEADISAAGHTARRFKVWPETFLREPLEDGIRLAAAADGYEGQVWSQGFLTFTRWWKDVPSQRDWTIFLRTAGIDLGSATQATPEPATLGVLPAPWTIGTTSADDVWSLLQTERVAAIAMTVIAIPFLYLVGQAIIVSIATSQTDAAINDLTQTNQTVRVSRNEALTNLDDIEAYLSLETFPPQYEVLTRASRLLQGRDLTIVEWVYDNGTLSISLDSSSPLDSTFFIEAFEKDELFSNVSGTSGVQQDSLRLSMQVEAEGQRLQ